MFSITLKGDTELIAAFDDLPIAAQAALSAKVAEQTMNLATYIISQKLSGQVLQRRSGALSNSIFVEGSAEGAKVTGYVKQSGDVKYGRIHEYGFSGSETVKAHMRTVLFGREVAPYLVPSFTRQMNMPERSFMRSSLRENAAEIEAGLKKAAADGIRKALLAK